MKYISHSILLMTFWGLLMIPCLGLAQSHVPWNMINGNGHDQAYSNQQTSDGEYDNTRYTHSNRAGKRNTRLFGLSAESYSGYVWHVATTGSDETGDGSEENPFATIQHGIEVSSNNDTVLVDGGIYAEKIDFLGKSIVVTSITGPENTILDGNNGITGSIVTFVSGEDPGAVLSGFSIINGSSSQGGGIYCFNSSPSLHRLIISNNFVSAGNVGIGYGGGLYCSNSSPVLEEVIFNNNRAGYLSGWGVGMGGAIALFNSNPIFRKVTISENIAYGPGGGVYCIDSSPVFEFCSIISNSADNGGGVFYSTSLEFNRSVSPLLSNVTIYGNSAYLGGGIYCSNNSRPGLVNTILWNDSPQEIYFDENSFWPSSITVAYSDIQGGEEGIETNDNGIINWLDGNIDAYPLFADTSGGDYYLQEGSPCIDAGTAFFVWDSDTLVDLSPDDYIGSMPDIGAYEYEPQSEPLEIIVEYLSGWNLVGLPFEMDLFPCPGIVEGSIFAFDSGYYINIPEEDMITGKGYWARFEDSGPCVFSGIPTEIGIIVLVQGWNLICGIPCAVAVSDINDPDGLIVPGSVYGFDGTFFNTDTLEPGHGYWLISRADGVVTVICNTRTEPKYFVNRMEGSNKISFNDQTLYFGVSVPEDDRLSYSLPPKPPLGAFDARFIGDWKYVEEGGEIEVMNNAESLTVSYAVVNEIDQGMEWVLTSGSGEEYVLTGSGEFNVTGNIDRFVLTKRNVVALPIGYALQQNYPNPFNPVTTIRYSLSEPSYVTFSIYDLNGRLIKNLINTMEDAGYKSVIWDATDEYGKPVSAGVYLYQITAGNFIQTRKLMLLK